MTSPGTTRPRFAVRRFADAAGRRPGLMVAAAFAVTAAYLAVRAAQVKDYVWLIDELLYVKVAQSFAGGELLRAEVYDGSVAFPNTLYPRLLAPLYGLLPSVDAFTAAHILNALMFASVIVPVYLTARRLEVPWGLALLAGVASAWVPWAVATTVVMTESLAYPAFAWASFAIVVALDEPRMRHHVLALLAIGLASFARIQFALLLPVFLAVILLQAVATENAVRRRGQTSVRLVERLRPHASLGVMLAAVVGVLGVLALADVNPLGTYQYAADRMRFPPGWLESSSWHLAHVIVGLGILPAVLWVAWLARVATNPRSGAELGFAIYAALAVGVLVYTAGDFAQNVAGGRIQERYLFYVAPILLLGSAALLADRREPRPRLSLVAAGALVAVVVSVPDYNPAVGGDGFQIVAAAFSGFVRVIEGRTAGLRELTPGDGLTVVEMLVLASLVAGLLLLVVLRLRWRPVAAPMILAAVAIYGAVEAHYLLNRAIPSINAGWQGIPGEATTPRDWVDRAVPGDEDVGLLPFNANRDPWLRVEFWNESVDGQYTFPGHGGITGFPALTLEVDEASGEVEVPREMPFLVAQAGDPVLDLQGEVVGRAGYGLELIRPERPYRARWWVGEEFADGYSKGTRARRIGVYQAGPVTLSVTAPAEADGPVRYEVGAAGDTVRGRLEPAETEELTLPVEPGADAVTVRALDATELPDGRRVGVKVLPG